MVRKIRRDSSPPELLELIEISRAVGRDPDLVQGGGGNTSVKSRDGTRLWVKASGTSLAEMDATRGWAELDLAAARDVLRIDGLAGRPAREREAEVLRLLQATVRQPAGARPSVESSLHALLDRVVIHTHPVGLNAFLCCRESRKRFSTLLRGVADAPLYVPYVDPGYTLAARVERDIARHCRVHGGPPSVLLLENHGVFVAAPDVRQCLRLSRRVTDVGMKWIRERRVNPRSFAALVRVGRSRAVNDCAVEIRGALLRGGSAPVIVRGDSSAVAREFLADPGHVRASRRGAFTPDQIVYCRTSPLVLPGDRPGRWDGLVAAYRERCGVDPRVIIVPENGVYHAGNGLGQLRVVGEVYRVAMTAIVRGEFGGGPRFLGRRQAGFIEDWEVEHFRAAVQAGSGATLRGRVVVVVGSAQPVGRRAVRELENAGATVVELDLRASNDAALRRAFAAVATSMGGLDGIVLAARTRVFPAIRQASRLFDRQGTGGAAIVPGKSPRATLLDAWRAELESVGARLEGVRSTEDVVSALDG